MPEDITKNIENTTDTIATGIENVVGDIGKQEFWGFSLTEITLLVSAIVLGYIFGKLAVLTLRHIEKRSAENQEIFSIIVRSIAGSAGFLGLLWGVKAGVAFLDIDDDINSVIQTVINVLICMSIGFIFYQLVDVPYTIFRRWADKQDSRMIDMVGPMIRTSLRIAVIILTFVQIAQIISNQPITSIIAGLGIGGLAFALAAQDSIKHLFGSLVIFADRPFEVGDRIIVDGVDGNVEQVGFRSTRVRTLAGHLVTFPNGELANKNIENVGKRPHIRRIMNVTITYDTPPEKIRRAIEIIEGLLEDHEGMDEEFPPRVYFNDLNADSLNLFVIFWYHPADWWAYNEFQQKLLFGIFEKFGEEGIEFAFPTQTLFLAGDENRPLSVGVQELAAKAKKSSGSKKSK